MSFLLIPLTGVLLGFLFHVFRFRKVVLPYKVKDEETGVVSMYVGFLKECIGGLFVSGIAYLIFGTGDERLQVMGTLGGAWFLYNVLRSEKK